MKSILSIVACLLAVDLVVGYEYNFQITHGPSGPTADGSYETQARSSVHVRGSQPHPGAAPAAEPVYKDEQAYASEGYHGYSAAAVSDKAQVPQYAASHQPDVKYRYAVEGRAAEEPQTEIRYVSQQEAAKYQQGPQAIKYVSSEEAYPRAYQQQTAAYQQAPEQVEKYAGYRPASEKYAAQEYEAPKYQAAAFEHAPQAQKYVTYQQAPVAEKYQTYEPAQQPKYHESQPAPQAYHRAPETSPKFAAYQEEAQPEKYQTFQSPNQLQKFSQADVEPKVQYVNAEPHHHRHHQPAAAQQYGHSQAEQQVQYVPQYSPQSGHEAQVAHAYGQPAAYSQPLTYQYSPEAAKYQREPAKFETYQQAEGAQYAGQAAAYGKDAGAEHKYVGSYEGGQKVKFEFPAAAAYEQAADQDYQLKSAGHKGHGVAQSASVAQPVAHRYAAPAHTALTQVAAHGASAYGHAYTGNAHAGYGHPGYAHPGSYAAHNAEAYVPQSAPGSPEAAGYGPVHVEPQTRVALQAYHVPQGGQHLQGASHLPVHKASGQQHSFPDHLAHGLARGHGHKVHDFYDDKKSSSAASAAAAASKKASKKKSS